MPAFPSPNSRVLVVCHDAGGAQIAIPWAADRGNAVLCVDGPAARIARDHELPLVDDLEAALCDADWVLTGTGWQTDLEHRARRLARTRALFNVAWLDHWVNYAERFERDGEVVRPDEYWVVDTFAEAEARRHFPHDAVRRVASPFHERQREELRQVERGDETLLLLEPARADWGRGTPGEFQALDHLWSVERPKGRTRLRPHPSDPDGKYTAWIEDHPGVELDTSPTLLDALRGAGRVFGLETQALVWAGEAGFDVATMLPPWAPDCRLPHDFVRRLRAHSS